MDGKRMRAVREQRAESAAGFADWLNAETGRKYDRHRISRWETGGMAIPADVARVVATQELALGLRTFNALVLAVANQKGGVGKTATAVNVAYTLAQDGYKVLLIDADSQSNATVHVGIDKGTLVRLAHEGRTLYHVLTQGAEAAVTIQPTDSPGLDILASSLLLANADTELALDPTSGGALALRNALGAIRRQYDFIIVDCAPNLGFVTLSALTAADYVLIPTQTEPHSMMGIEHLVATLAKLRSRLNTSLDVLGIVPTQFKARYSQDRDSLAELVAEWGQKTRIFDPIPERTSYAQAAAAGKITMAVFPSLPGTATYHAIAAAMLEKAGQREVCHGG